MTENSFYDRLLLLIGTEEPFRFAKRIGIPNATFARILSTRSIPKHEHLCRIAQKCGVTLDWLLLGADDYSRAQRGKMLPVVGFAGCGLAQGWFNERQIHVMLPIPVSLSDEKAFAVVCRGMSMCPTGIDDGDICVISPAVAPQKGKPALIRTHSYIKGKDVVLSTIKRYDGGDEKVIRLCGWLDPDESGHQDSFCEERTRSVVENVYPVVQILKNSDVFGTSLQTENLNRDAVVQSFDALKPFLQTADSQQLAILFQLFYSQVLQNGSDKTHITSVANEKSDGFLRKTKFLIKK